MIKRLDFRKCSILLLLSVINFVSGNSKLIVINDSLHLKSSDFNYTSNPETLDVIWLFEHSIRLTLNSFHLDGHSGDFVLISEIPLLHKEEFIDLNNTADGSYVDKLAQAILTDQGILLSWKVDKQFQAVNEGGTFVYFHTEARVPEAISAFDGFDIEVANYDDETTTTTSTTPDPVVSEKPGQEIYISKFLSCMEPLEFFNKTDYFKGNISKLATEYCHENGIVLVEGPINKTEVNIPGPDGGPLAGIHYCDTTWKVYPTCVEVTFAITRLDNVGNYILPKSKLEQMWSKKADHLSQYGFCPYTPPESPLDLNILVWLVFFLGIIFALSIILVFAWVKNTRSIIHYRTSIANNKESFTDQMDKVETSQLTLAAAKHYDKENPILKLYPNQRQNSMSSFYPSDPLTVGYAYNENGGGGGDTPAAFKKHSFTQNPTFENAHVEVYAFENRGYEPENDSSRFTRDPTGTRRRNNDDEGLVLMNRVAPGSLSDTEI